MRVLVIGSGAREQAIAWKISRSTMMTNLYQWPINKAFWHIGGSIDLDSTASAAAVAQQANKLDIDLVILGSEFAVNQGLANALQTYRIACFGPTKVEAHFESDLSYAKKIAADNAIPINSFWRVVSFSQAYQQALKVLGEGHFVNIRNLDPLSDQPPLTFYNRDQIEQYLTTFAKFHDQKTPQALLVEEIRADRQCSYFAFCGSQGLQSIGFVACDQRYRYFIPSANNTHIKSSVYTPVEWLPDDAEDQVEKIIVKPLTKALQNDAIDYCGWLNIRLNWTAEGPRVIEWKCCLGDPEAQVLAVSDARDWLRIIVDIMSTNRKTNEHTEKMALSPTCALVLAEHALKKTDIMRGIELSAASLKTNDTQTLLFCSPIEMSTAARSDAITNPLEALHFTIVAKDIDVQKAHDAGLEQAKQITENVFREAS